MAYPSNWFWLPLLLVACRSGPQVNPDDLSAAGHRAEAAREYELAAEASRPKPGPPEPTVVDRPSGATVYQPRSDDPAELDRERAARHRAHARAHEEAAAELERFEAQECKGLLPAERFACPLLGPVSAVTDVPHGVRIRLSHPEAAPVVLARMRCHLAFARARGFERVATCPLYLRGLRLEPGPDAGEIDLLVDDPAREAELRQLTREEVFFQAEPTTAGLGPAPTCG
jgi:hypothetical protein